MRPRPLREFPAEARRRVRRVLCDIDDTLTLSGRLPAIAYTGLERLSAAGFTVVPITGRPAGWCDMIARFWPVDGVVGENGAFYFRYDHGRRVMVRRFVKDEAERAADRRRLADLEARILAEVPGAKVAADQAYRVADLAIDVREDVTPLPREAIDRIVALFEAAGATAKVSSIHVNGWFGRYDKLATTRRFYAEALGADLEAERETTVFVGDSPNDVPMFRYFPNAVGVANVADFADRLAAWPRWITTGRGGHGFAEVAEALLEAR